MAVAWPPAMEAGSTPTAVAVVSAELVLVAADRNLLCTAGDVERVIGDGNAGAQAARRLRGEGDRDIA